MQSHIIHIQSAFAVYDIGGIRVHAALSALQSGLTSKVGILPAQDQLDDFQGSLLLTKGTDIIHKSKLTAQSLHLDQPELRAFFQIQSGGYRCLT